jgi:hypothetical protein
MKPRSQKSRTVEPWTADQNDGSPLIRAESLSKCRAGDISGRRR